MNLTYEMLFEMIYAIDPEDRMDAEFSCDRHTACDLRKVHDEDGRYAAQPDYATRGGFRCIGYPVRVVGDCETRFLTFGPSSRCEDRANGDGFTAYLADDKKPASSPTHPDPSP